MEAQEIVQHVRAVVVQVEEKLEVEKLVYSVRLFLSPRVGKSSVPDAGIEVQRASARENFLAHALIIRPHYLYFAACRLSQCAES